MPAEFSNIGYDFLNPPPFATIVFVGPGPQVAVGDDQNNVINAGAGGDTMIGGAGDDLFRDGAGLDSISGGAGFDRLSFAFAPGTTREGVVASLATGTVYDDGFGNVEHITGIEALGGGTLFADTMTGDDQANLLVGDAGDLLFGLGGDDVLVVGAAPALADGGSGVNSLNIVGAHLGVDQHGRGVFVNDDHGATVDLSRGLIVDAGDGTSGVIQNIQNVFAGPLNDLIIGDRHDNVLAGLAGDDTLTGGGGHDIFFYSDDAFDFDGNPIGNGHDVITDFNRGLDKIEFGMVGVKSMADLTISQDAQGDVVIGFGSMGETITLLGVRHVNQTDFLFGA
jgi:Ca2+-binding RTX toxin-like protein